MKVGGYIRYVDDFVIFDKDKAVLQGIKAEMTVFLNQIRLLPHVNKTQIHRVEDGVPFLGFQVTPQYRTVKKDTMKRYFRYLGKKIAL